jgi:CheY-like chemotaxis protein
MVCRILVADDSSTIQKVIRIGLAGIPCDIRPVASYAEACKATEGGHLDLIIADAGLPGIAMAVDFMRLRERAGHIPMILLMGSYDEVRESDLRAVGIENIIKKPFPPGELPQLVQKLMGTSFTQSLPRSDVPASRPKVPMTPPPPPTTPLAFSLTPDDERTEIFTPKGNPGNQFSGVPSFPLGDAGGHHNPPPSPELEIGLRGRPAFDLTGAEESGLRKSFSSSESLKALTNLTMASGNFNESNTNDRLPEAVEAFVKSELPALVGRAVERYCAENFKVVAREVLTSELRRLAEEKARYLENQ